MRYIIKSAQDLVDDLISAEGGLTRFPFLELVARGIEYMEVQKESALFSVGYDQEGQPTTFVFKRS